MKEDFRLDTTKPTQDFNSHLSIEGNNRIIFSGPFGSGKTSFLKEYFAEKENYEVFHLFPVNYSVASNGDIFELIKFDLLFELLGRDVDLEKADFSKQMTLQIFLLNNQFEVAKTFYESIKPLFEGVSKTGKDVTEIFNPISKLYKKWQEYHSKIQIDEQKGIIAYLESFTKKPEGVHEEDIFTQIIRNLLAQIKDKGKEVILIIDDLDRIDPEHIFRILNIFAAHFDSTYHKFSKDENKFGFNQIMLVCDLNNIRNIFFNKYGQDVDFTGYIDKFYAKDVFVFDNIRVMEDTIKKVLNSIEYCQPSNYYFKDGDDEILVSVITELVKSNSLNLRDLQKIYNLKYTFKLKEIVCVSNRTMRAPQFYELVLINFLTTMLGDIENLKKAIIKTNRSNILSRYHTHNQYECSKILTLFLQETHKFKISNEIFSKSLDSSNSCFSFTLNAEGMHQYFYHITPNVYDKENEYTNLNFFDLLLNVIEMAQTKKYLN